MKKLIFTIFCTLLISQSFAHALWIETAPLGKKGQKHELKIYYGEYATNERDSVGKWYSDVKEFTLWLTAPGKEKVKLETTAGLNFYSASFSPEADGIYTLTISHEAKDLGGTTKYEFLSSAVVSVGKAGSATPDFASRLQILPAESKVYKQNAEVKLIAKQNGQPFANKAVSVFSPEGWTKELTTNEKGEISVRPEWAGVYVVEVSNMEKKSGEHQGQSYTAAWQGATSSFIVAK